MSYKTGRNDPCPCGSGKKYKNCCGNSAAAEAPAPQTHDGAVQLAIVWLEQHHRKAFSVALKMAIDSAVSACFDSEKQARQAMAKLDQEFWRQAQINLTEWLLAEGELLVKGEPHWVSELLLGPQGPSLSTDQRAWLAQLARRPMRLYDVTEVVRGVGLTVCDVLDTGQAPVLVDERSGSQSLRPGMQIGARVMEVGKRHQFSGAIYPFSILSAQSVQARLRDLTKDGSLHPADQIHLGARTIIEAWFGQYLLPAPMPQFIDSHSGEPMLLTTDYYGVQNWDALAAALATQADVQGDRTEGWTRLLDCDDGQTRSQAAINIEPKDKGVSVFYKTALLAKRGRAWFDALAGDAVKFESREVSDPTKVLSRSAGAAGTKPQQKAPTLPAGMDAKTLGDVIEAALKRSYANWADQPIPALQDRTPRQAMQSAAGLERVKGLLRSYEDGEVQQAAQQGRRQISYQFLWESLGLHR